VPWTRASACTGDYAGSLGKVPLPVTELTGRVASLASFTTGLGLYLDTFNFLQTTILGRIGLGTSVEGFHNVRVVRTNYHTKSPGGDASYVSVRAGVLRGRNADYP